MKLECLKSSLRCTKVNITYSMKWIETSESLVVHVLQTSGELNNLSTSEKQRKNHLFPDSQPSHPSSPGITPTANTIVHPLRHGSHGLNL